MPKRTNDFQKLVALVQMALAPDGAVVRESQLMDSQGAIEAREIDVLIDTKVGDYRIKIAVEAKDEGRPMDSTKFEAIMGKYLVEGGVKVNKVVVVTRRGFYQPVIERAKTLEVDLLTLTEAQETDWSSFRPPGPCFSTRPQICNITIAPVVPGVEVEKVFEAGRVVCSCGWQHGSVAQYAAFLFWKIAVRKYHDVLSKLDDEAIQKGTETKAHVEIKCATPHEPMIEINGQQFRFDIISFDVRFTKDAPPAPPFLGHITFSIAPHVSQIELIPPIAGEAPSDLQKEARIVCQCCGKDHGKLADWAHDKAMRRVLPVNKQAQEMLEKGLSESPTGHVQLVLSWPLCKNWRVRYRNQDWQVTHVKVHVHAATGASPLQCRQYYLTNPGGTIRRVSHLEASLAGGTISLVMPDGLDSRKIAVRLEKHKDQSLAKLGTKRLNTRRKRRKP